MPCSLTSAAAESNPWLMRYCRLVRPGYSQVLKGMFWCTPLKPMMFIAVPFLNGWDGSTKSGRAAERLGVVFRLRIVKKHRHGKHFFRREFRGEHQRGAAGAQQFLVELLQLPRHAQDRKVLASAAAV